MLRDTKSSRVIMIKQHIHDFHGSHLPHLQAWCLNLEYSISGAAVAASWGSKVLNLCSDEVVAYMYPPMTSLFSVNIFAGMSSVMYCSKIDLHL